MKLYKSQTNTTIKQSITFQKKKFFYNKEKKE